MKLHVTFFFLILTLTAHGQICSGKNGSIKLMGVAPQETITAESTTLMGKLDLGSNNFNFKQSLSQFRFSQGDLQKKDAEEVYWETHKYPHASFTGKIINDVNLKTDGTYKVTAVGIFSMHGVDKEMKIPAIITVKEGSVALTSQFKLFLSDFKIKIPRLVVMKVSEEFQANISLTLNKSAL